MSSLEDYIKQQEEAYDFSDKEDIQVELQSNPGIKRLKADKQASLYDLIVMIGKLVKITMPKVNFIPDEGKNVELDSMKNFDNPVITYKLKERTVKNEKKPRIREVINEKDLVGDDEVRIGEVYGQKFKCYIQFNVIATDYESAESVMSEFELLLFKYTGYFKDNGVAEIVFEKQYTDDFYAKLRETLSVRNLIYYVEIEKLTVIFKERIKEIEEKLSTIEEE